MPFKDPEEQKLYEKRRRLLHPEKRRAIEHRSYHKNLEKNRERKRKTSLAWHNAHPEVRRRAAKKWYEKMKAHRPKKEKSKVKIGDTFGSLTVLGDGKPYQEKKGKRFTFECRCDCGSTVHVTGYRLLRIKGTKSCGCQPNKYTLERRRKAGMADDFCMTPHNKAERAKFGFLIKKKIRKRDAHTCQLCGQIGRTLHVHHVRPWRSHVELRFDERNLITLCKSCHLYKAHSGSFNAITDEKIAATLLEILLKKYQLPLS